MVVGPKELKRIIEQEDKPKIEQLEAKIDACLKEKFTGQGGVYVGSGLFSDIRPLLVETVLEKYRAAGWDVKYDSDQREGSWYTFTAKASLSGKEKVRQDFFSLSWDEQEAIREMERYLGVDVDKC